MKRAYAIAALALMGACHGSDGESPASALDGGAPSPDGATPSGSAPAGFFDACGGKIIDSAGVVSATEYRKQAASWDGRTIDCRLGPKYAVYHPGDADGSRPTAPELPLLPNPKAYLCPQFDHATPGPAGYGSTAGQVAYAPDDPSDPGLDRLQTSGWEGSGQCYQPLQGGWLGGPHPDPAVPGWRMKIPALGVPIAKARTEHNETGDGVVIFSSGLIGTTGTKTSNSTHPTLLLPPNKVPTAVAMTNYNEFALVTVWDTEKLKGQIAVIALRAPNPGAFSINLFAAPNEGGFSAMQLLGYVDLPDMATPTAIAIAGNNAGHNGPWIQSGPGAYQGIGSLFKNLDYASMTANPALSVWTSDPTTGPGLFGTSGGAIVASQWENKVSFLDLSPLFAFVRKVYIEPIAKKDNEALYTQATAPGAWPFDFTSHPEMTPKLVSSMSVPEPRVVRFGIAARGKSGFTSKLLAWVGRLDGHIAAYDVSSLSGRASGAGAPIAKIAEVAADPNPTSMHLTNTNDELFISSRGNRSVQWLAASAASIDVVRTFRDSRVGDPVATDHNQRMSVITVGDFSAGTVMNFERDTTSCADAGAGGTETCGYLFDGALKFPGAVYFVDTANVN